MQQDPDAPSDEQEELYEHFRFTVDPGQQKLRIDKFLISRMGGTSRSRIQSAAEAGCILVNGAPVKSNYKVRPEDVVSLVLAHPPRDRELKPENMPLEIIYEDDDVLVINKPAGLVVHPGHGNFSGTLVNGLIFHFQQLPSMDSERPRPGLVHRIDKNTTGLMVVARNELSMSKLARQFFDHTIGRAYVALVWGDVRDESGTVTGSLGRSPKDRRVMTVFPNGEEGKHAVTHYTVLERFRYVTLLECRLETGRTHQIRAHMKHIGHPLFNDDSYGGNRIVKGTTFTKYRQFIDNCFTLLPRQALHAQLLEFTHPSTGERLSFRNPLPGDMEAVLKKWRRYSSGHANEPGP